MSNAAVTGSTATGNIQVDKENPFLGLASFEEKHQDYFYGREEEIRQLLRLVRRETLTVLFGVSGLGKTSLLQAGLFPLLRQHYLLPISIRLVYGPGALPPEVQIRDTVTRQVVEHCKDSVATKADETLWEYFHRVPLWNQRNRLLTPVLVFDQFEELFTLGPGTDPKQPFLQHLADLAENLIPEPVAARLANTDQDLPYAHDRPAVKIIFCLREDYLAHLEDLRPLIPSLDRNRYRLTPMDGEQALEAVVKPGAELVDPAAAEQIVRFVAGKEQRDKSTGVAISLQNLVLEPALLSLICLELNRRRQNDKAATISVKLLKISQDQILTEFYQDCLQGLDPGVGRYIEEELLTRSGSRSTKAKEDALQARGVTQQAINALVDSRLLRLEERLGIPHLELIHDVMVQAVRESREQRRQQEKIRNTVNTFLVLMTITAVLLAGLLFWQSDKTMDHYINALLESSENALLSSKQLEALIMAVKTEKMRQEISGGLRGWVRPIFDSRGEAETESKSVSVLHRVLSEIREKNRLQGHSDRVNRVVFSPNCHGLGPHLASASEDRMVKLWRRDGTLLRSLLHEDAVTDVAFSPDCRILASTSFNGEIRFWNREGENIEKKSDKNSLTSISFSSDGRFVAWGNDAGHVMFGTPLGEDFKRIEANKRGAIHVSFSPICPDGGEFLLSASENRVDTERIKIWSLDGRLIQALAGHTDKVTNAAISPDCTMIATAGNDKKLLLWKRDGREYILDKTLNGHTGPITDVDFSPDNQMIVFSGESDVSSPTDNSNIVKVWDLKRDNITSFKGHNAPVTSVSISPDGQTIASASGDNSVRLWSTDEVPVRETVQGNGDALRGVFSPHGDKLVVTLKDNSLDLWDLSSGKHKIFKTEGDSFPKVINDPSGDFFTLDLRNKALRTLDGERVMAFKADNGNLAAISFSPDKNLIATSSDKNTITLWTGDGKPIETFDGYSKSNKTLRFSPDGKNLAFLAAKDQQHSVVLRRIGTPNPIALPKQKGAINDISFSPDSNILATAGEDHLINLWHIDSREVKTLSGHGAAVTSVIFHPDGKMLASAGYDDKIKLWTRNGRELLSLAGSPNIWDIAFAQNGNQLVAVAQDGELMRWNFDPDDLLRRACHWLIDYLQTNEVLRKEDKTICTPKD